MTARRLPADFAPVRPKTKPTGGSEPSLGPTVPVTDEQRDDARRAVTRASTVGGWSLAETREVLDVLGLLPVQPIGPYAVECPLCGAAVGAQCSTTGNRGAFSGAHKVRREAAEV